MKVRLYLLCLGLFSLIFQDTVYAAPTGPGTPVDPENRCCSYVRSDGTKFCDATHNFTYPKHECKRKALAEGATAFRWGPTKEKGSIPCINGECVDEEGNPLSEEKLIVNLSVFTIIMSGSNIQINWLTEFEENNLGMNLWCAQMQGDQFREITQLNSELIPSKAILPNYGASYSSTDYPYINTNLKPGVQHCALEDIDASGQCTLHCDQIDTVIIGESNNLSDMELNELQTKAIALCHEHKQDGVCLDQLLAPNTP